MYHCMSCKNNASVPERLQSSLEKFGSIAICFGDYLQSSWCCAKLSQLVNTKCQACYMENTMLKMFG